VEAQAGNFWVFWSPAGAEDAGCQEDVLPFPWWTAFSAASADPSGTVNSVPCTYPAVATAIGTVVSTSLGQMVKSTGCFKCGKEGHFARECPKNRPTQSPQPFTNSRLIKRTVIKKKVPMSRSGQVNYTEAEEILQDQPMMDGIFTINSHPTLVLFDSRASHSFTIMAIPKAYRINTLGAKMFINTWMDTVSLVLPLIVIVSSSCCYPSMALMQY
jgi:hypothetical protein